MSRFNERTVLNQIIQAWNSLTSSGLVQSYNNSTRGRRMGSSTFFIAQLDILTNRFSPSMKRCFASSTYPPQYHQDNKIQSTFFIHWSNCLTTIYLHHIFLGEFFVFFTRTRDWQRKNSCVIQKKFIYLNYVSLNELWVSFLWNEKYTFEIELL